MIWHNVYNIFYENQSTGWTAETWGHTYTGTHGKMVILYTHFPSLKRKVIYKDAEQLCCQKFSKPGEEKWKSICCHTETNENTYNK